ncbi:MAG TPA: ComEC/Rec2 family competence protein [Bacteroidia bacterium]|nr:ComEC/Rec2 family competence protein [Bacteroidia bacterium]
MKTWTRVPVFRLLVPFAFGILSGLSTDFSLHTALISFFTAFCVNGLFTFKKYATGAHAHRWLMGIPLYTSWYFAGYLIMVLKSAAFVHTRPPSTSVSIVSVDDNPSWKSKAVRFTGTLWTPVTNTALYRRSAKVMVRIGDAGVINPVPGDLMVLRSAAEEVKSPMNPGQFDYKAYLKRSGIRLQINAKSNAGIVLKAGNPAGLKFMAVPVRNTSAELLKRALPDSALLGVAGALILGEDRWMEQDIQAGFSSAGVLHVLCVSGMHVVLLLTIIEKILNLLRIPVKLKFLQYLILIGVTWYYTSLTGFSPSIIRAAMMMTLVLASKLFHKSGNLSNNMAATALIMFLFEPAYLFNAGFQLSFLAVLGIFHFYNQVKWNPVAGGKIVQAMRDMVAVSVAAQAATFAVSLFYFHRFPTYFMIANLVIVPLATIVLYLGMLMLSLGWISILGEVLRWALSNTLKALIFCTTTIANWPGSVIDGIYINLFECLLLLLVVACCYFLIVEKSFRRLRNLLIGLALFFGTTAYNRMKSADHKEFLVFRSPANPVLVFTKSESAVVLTPDSAKAIAIIKGHLLQNNIRHIQYIKLNYGSCIKIRNGKQKILWQHSYAEASKNTIALTANDWLVTDKGINSADNSAKKDSVHLKSFSCHVVDRQGAFTIRLSGK